MITPEEVEKLALELPEEQRAALAAHILDSLPPLLSEEDEGIAEALRRDAEMSSDPTIGIPLQDFDRRIRQRK